MNPRKKLIVSILLTNILLFISFYYYDSSIHRKYFLDFLIGIPHPVIKVNVGVFILFGLFFSILIGLFIKRMVRRNSSNTFPILFSSISYLIIWALFVLVVFGHTPTTYCRYYCSDRPGFTGQCGYSGDTAISECREHGCKAIYGETKKYEVYSPDGPVFVDGRPVSCKPEGLKTLPHYLYFGIFELPR